MFFYIDSDSEVAVNSDRIILLCYTVYHSIIVCASLFNYKTEVLTVSSDWMSHILSADKHLEPHILLFINVASKPQIRTQIRSLDASPIIPVEKSV